MLKCVFGQGYLSVGMTQLGGLWLRGQIAIVGRVKIAVSVWLNVGRFAPRSEHIKYWSAANVWISSRSRPMRSYQISLQQNVYGDKLGRVYIKRSSEKIQN